MVDAWLILAVYALAHARLTGLVVADDITRPVRDAVLRRVGVVWCEVEGRYHAGPGCVLGDEGPVLSPGHARAHWLAKLITCAWCAGLWLAAPVAAVAVWHSGVDWRLVPALALAYGYVTGATSDLGRR